MAAIHYLRLKGTVTTPEYQNLYTASKATATRDLGDLMAKKLVVREGKGTTVNYRLAEPS